MGIQITGGEIKPAVEYNKVHLTALEIIQPVFSDDNSQPIYNVNISYRMYGVVDGIRYYKDEPIKRISLNDFLSVAMADAAQGDLTLINALQSIETAVAAILSDQLGISASVI